MKRCLFVLCALLALCTLCNAELRSDALNTVPGVPWDRNAPTQIQTWQKFEGASIRGRLFSPFVYSGGVHSTSATLTTETFATEAFVPERVNQAALAITYVAADGDTCYTIISSASSIAGWTQVGSSGYYFRCAASATQPTLPANSAWLMRVSVSGSPLGITAVVPIYRTNPNMMPNISFFDPVIGGKCNGIADDQAAFNRAAALLAAGNRTLYIPDGDCITTSPSPLLTISGGSGYTVNGAGLYANIGGRYVGTRLRNLGTGGGILLDTDSAGNRPQGVTIKNLTLIGGGVGGKAIDTNNCNQCTIDTISASNWLNHVIDFRGTANLHNIVRNSRLSGDQTSTALTACRIVNFLAGNILTLEYNYFNGAGVTNASGCAVSVEASGDVTAIGNTYDRTAEAVRTSGQWTSIRERFDYTSAANLQAIISYHKTNNSALTVIEPNGPVLDSAAQVVFDGTDRRYISWIGASAPERGVRGGTAVWSMLNPPALTGNVNDYAPASASDSTFWRVDPGGVNRTITGIAGGVPGRILVIMNIGTGQLLLTNDDAASAAVNRIFTNTYATQHRIIEREVVLLIYDGTSSRWRIVENALPQRLFFAPTLNFGVPAVPGCLHLNATATGAAVGDRVIVAPSNVTGVIDGHHFFGKVLTADVVRVSVCQFDGVGTDPDGAGQVYNVDVWKN